MVSGCGSVGKAVASAVRIQSSAKFYLCIHYQLYWKNENKYFFKDLASFWWSKKDSDYCLISTSFFIFQDTVFEREKPTKRQEYLLVCGREIEALLLSKKVHVMPEAMAVVDVFVVVELADLKEFLTWPRFKITVATRTMLFIKSQLPPTPVFFTEVTNAHGP